MDERRHSHKSSHHRHRHRHRKGRDRNNRRPGKRQIILGILALVVLVIAFACLLKYMRQWETEKYRTQTSQTLVTVSAEQTDNVRSLSWNGSEYRSREGVNTLLLIGVVPEDNRERAELFAVFSTDTKNSTWEILLLDAQTVCTLPSNEEEKTLTLSQMYAEETDKTLSCENAADGVSTLLEGQPMDGYLALEADFLAQVIDSLGGVAVTVPVDLTFVNEEWLKGSEVILDGENALDFLLSAANRNENIDVQESFLAGFLNALKNRADTDFYASLWKDMQPFATTDLAGAGFTSMAAHMKQYNSLGVHAIASENTVEDGMDGRLLNEENRMDTVLSMFFEKVD